MDAEAVLAHASRVHIRRTSESLLLLGSGAAPEVLHGTGIALWDSFATPARASDVTASLAERYGADPAEVAHDSAPIIAALVAAGLLTEAAP